MKIDYTQKSAKIVTATKELVDELLEHNPSNRNVKKSHLAWLMESLNEGEFILTGQGISVGKDGKLIDGQHRLMAIREAGYPSVELLVVTGLDPKARIYIDQHAKRSITDMLKVVVDETISNRMAGVVSMHLKVREDKENGFIIVKHRQPLQKIIAAMAKHEKFLSQIVDGSGMNARAGVMCGIFHFGLKYNRDDALEFAEQVKNGEKLVKTDPAYKLRGYIIGKLGKRFNYGGTGMIEDYKHAVACCISYAQNRKMESLRPVNSWDGLPK